MLAVADNVMPRPAHHAHVVDAAVLEETAVFNGQHRLDMMLRNFVIGELPALGAVHVLTQAGDEQRLQLITGQCLAMIVRY